VKDFDLKAIPAEQLEHDIDGTDVVLIAPQISYKKDYVESVTKPRNIPYVIIPQETYGAMDGATVVKEALIAQRKQAILNQKIQAREDA